VDRVKRNYATADISDKLKSWLAMAPDDPGLSSEKVSGSRRGIRSLDRSSVGQRAKVTRQARVVVFYYWWTPAYDDSFPLCLTAWGDGVRVLSTRCIHSFSYSNLPLRPFMLAGYSRRRGQAGLNRGHIVIERIVPSVLILAKSADLTHE
jgi:hypothetical protein